MSINRLLNELLNLKTDRLVARSEDSWEEYHVNDSLGSRIIIKEGQKTTLDIFVGRFNYQQPQGGYGRYAQNYGTGYTYVRLKQDDEIYSVEGFLSMSVNQPFEQWRNNLFLKINKNQVSGMVFDYPVDSGFVIRKTDTLWLLDGVKADSARMAGFLGGITGKRGSEFWNGPVPQKSPEYTIGIEGRNMEPVLIEAYEQGNDNFILHSSQNPESFFISGRNGIFEDLFKSRSFFFTGLP